MPWEALLTGLALLLALGYVLRSIHRMVFGKGGCGGCKGECKSADPK